MRISCHYFFALLCALLFINKSSADTLGSTSSPSMESSHTFPTGTFNQIIGFAWIREGFSFQDSATTCSWEGIFPVSGTIDLQGGTLSLGQHLVFHDTTLLQGLGAIVANGYTIELCHSVTYLPGNTASFSDVTLRLSNDILFTSTVTFSGDCTIDGDKKDLNLGTSGAIVVASGSTLTLRDMTIKGLADFNISCADDTATIILDNIVWHQDNNFTFSMGALQFVNNVEMLGEYWTFAYQSESTSTVQAKSNLILDENFTFSYDPIFVVNQNLIEFIDNSSQLILQGATLHATATGMQLTKGQLKVVRYGNLESEVVSVDPDGNLNTGGIIFGDNANADNDMLCVLVSDAILYIAQGTLNWENMNLSSMVLDTFYSAITVSDGTQLNNWQTLDIGGSVVNFYTSVWGTTSTSTINGSINEFGTITFLTLPG